MLVAKVPWPEPVPAPGTSNVVKVAARAIEERPSSRPQSAKQSAKDPLHWVHPVHRVTLPIFAACRSVIVASTFLVECHTAVDGQSCARCAASLTAVT